MATLTKRELDKLALAIPTVRGALLAIQQYGVLPPATSDPNYPIYLRRCKEFAGVFLVPALDNVLLLALETYEELDAELLAAQETIADLENTLEDANRDLTALLKRIEARKVDGYTPIVILE